MIMNRTQFLRFRALVSLFVMALLIAATTLESYLLATAAVFTGMLMLAIGRARTKIITDERDEIIQDKAARTAFAIFAPTIGLGAFLMLFPSLSQLEVFAKGDFLFLESVGMIFAYLALFIIVLYAISYLYFNRKFGGSREK